MPALRRLCHTVRMRAAVLGPRSRVRAGLVAGLAALLMAAAASVRPALADDAVREGVGGKTKNEVLPGFEPGSLDSESRVLTITP